MVNVRLAAHICGATTALPSQTVAKRKRMRLNRKDREWPEALQLYRKMLEQQKKASVKSIKERGGGVGPARLRVNASSLRSVRVFQDDCHVGRVAASVAQVLCLGA